MAALVKFAVIGKIGLGHDAEYFSVADGNGAVVEPVAVLYGSADEYERTVASRGAADVAQRAFDAFDERRLIEEVAAGIAAEGQLGKDYDLRALRSGDASYY